MTTVQPSRSSACAACRSTIGSSAKVMPFAVSCRAPPCRSSAPVLFVHCPPHAARRVRIPSARVAHVRSTACPMSPMRLPPAAAMP
jgi:hypothetical protein